MLSSTYHLSLAKGLQMLAEQDKDQGQIWQNIESRMVTIMSLTLGVTTALMTMVLVLSDERDSSTTESITPLLPAIVALFTTLMGASAMLLRKQSRRFVSKKEEGKDRTAKLPSSGRRHEHVSRGKETFRSEAVMQPQSSFIVRCVIISHYPNSEGFRLPLPTKPRHL